MEWILRAGFSGPEDFWDSLSWLQTNDKETIRLQEAMREKKSQKWGTLRGSLSRRIHQLIGWQVMSGFPTMVDSGVT